MPAKDAWSAALDDLLRPSNGLSVEEQAREYRVKRQAALAELSSDDDDDDVVVVVAPSHSKNARGNSSKAVQAVSVTSNAPHKRPSASLQEGEEAQVQGPTSTRAAPAKPLPLTKEALASIGPVRKKSKQMGISPIDSPVDSPRSPLADGVAALQVIAAPANSTTARSKPVWYSKYTKKDERLQHRSLGVKLGQTSDCIRACQQKQSLQEQFRKLRQQLHAMLYLEDAKLGPDNWAVTVMGSKILGDARGLPRIFDEKLSADDGVNYSWDIRADAQEVYNKWVKGDFDTNILRGIIIKKEGNRSTDSIDPKAKVPWNYFGAGNLVNGQWWPTQLATVRDGAHGSAQGGIAGVKATDSHPECGAVSIVLAGGYSEDRDEGDQIWYTGTEGVAGEPTENTKRLIESAEGYYKGVAHKPGFPVRVIRSHKLGTKSEYAPKNGFRYDGLYDVLGYKILDKHKAVHLFHLKRRADQDPIRATGVEARPTDEEVGAYVKIRKLVEEFM